MPSHLLCLQNIVNFQVIFVHYTNAQYCNSMIYTDTDTFAWSELRTNIANTGLTFKDTSSVNMISLVRP